MRSVWTAALVLAAASVWPGTGASSETLEDAWRLATAHDRGLAAAAAATEGAEAAERAARAARWPSLSAGGGYTRFDAAPQFEFATGAIAAKVPIFDGDESSYLSMNLRLPLLTGGRLSADIDAARQGTISALASERAARASLRLAVAQIYIDVLRAERRLHTQEATVTSLTAHLSDVQSMVERELVARSDLLAARVALANAQQERVRAENAVTLALAEYNRQLGEPLDRSVELDETVQADTGLGAQSLDALLRHALEARSEIAALAARADALSRQATSERAQLLPQLALAGNYTYLDSQILDRKSFSSIGLAVTWNLFDGGQTRNRAAALRSASRATQLRADDLRSAIELEVREAWLMVREARARLAASHEGVVQAEENLRMTRELYATGLGTNTQVLDAVALQISATNNRDDATLDESLALLKLARAVGTP